MRGEERVGKREVCQERTRKASREPNGAAHRERGELIGNGKQNCLARVAQGAKNRGGKGERKERVDGGCGDYASGRGYKGAL